MNQEIRNLEPKGIWNNFADLNAVPRVSKKEERVIAFMVEFGKNLGFETIIDPVQNVIIKKPATSGMENRKTIVLQSHLDMVCQKNNDTVFDFDTEGIKMKVEGDWVKAKGTTLGADNGLGVATIMTILESTDIPHPAIEALFTIDEETGMTGALGLQAGYLTGEILLNLDTEEDDEIGVGCAGGIDLSATKNYTEQDSTNGKAYKITVKGLQGGHSGMDIHKGFGNSNKLINRVLHAIQEDANIAEIDGGSLRNAIPRESNAIIVSGNDDLLKSKFDKITNEIIAEYKTIEKDIEITMVEVSSPSGMLSKEDGRKLIQATYSAWNGVYRMSPDIENLVETSNNVARVKVANGKMEILCLTRSSVESGKYDLVNVLESNFQLAGFNVAYGGSYPGWKPNPDSAILKVLEAKYETLFGKKAHVMACHAGLECGILGTNYPDMDMISFGPTIRGAHSPDERANIPSLQKFWKFLQEIIKDIPVKS